MAQKKKEVLSKKFAGKGMFKGVTFHVIDQSEEAYLLKLIGNKKGLTSYQVIDNDQSGKYPERDSQLMDVNVFRTMNQRTARMEFEKRKIKNS